MSANAGFFRVVPALEAGGSQPEKRMATGLAGEPAVAMRLANGMLALSPSGGSVDRASARGLVFARSSVGDKKADATPVQGPSGWFACKCS